MAVPSLTFIDSDQQLATQTTFTFSSKSLGDADSGRYIFVIVRGVGGNSDISSITIGGVSATKIVGLTSTPNIGIWGALVPTGTTGNIVVTFPNNRTGCMIGWYRVTGIANLTYHSASSQFANPTRLFHSDIPFGFFLGALSNEEWNGDISCDPFPADFQETMSDLYELSGVSGVIYGKQYSFGESGVWPGPTSPRGYSVYFAFATEYAISGVCSLNGTPIENATIRLIDQESGYVVDEQTTDSSGEYEFLNLDPARLYHACIEYEIEGTKYNAPSLWDLVPA